MRTVREAFARPGNLLDMLRLAFALLVLLAHCWPITFGPERDGTLQPSVEPVLWLTRHQIFGGTLAVLCFFLLSGFLVTESFQRCRGVLDYLRRRVRRIYPGYVVAMFVTAFVLAWPFATRPGSWLAEFPWLMFLQRTATLHMCATPETFASNPYPLQQNGSLWTIHLEFWCYLLVALLGVVGRLRSRAILWTLFGAAFAIWNCRTILGVQLLPPVHLIGFGNLRDWPELMTFFLAGMIVHRHGDGIPLRRDLFGLSVLCLGVSARTGGMTLALPFAGTYAVFWLAFADVSVLRMLTERRDLSYGVYLYAWPVQQTLVAAWPAVFVGAPWWLALAATPTTLGFALLSWHLVEAPFSRRKRRVVI